MNELDLRRKVVEDLSLHAHEYALQQPNRLIERIDIVTYANKRADDLDIEAAALGFCQAARDLRIQAKALREFGSLLIGGEHFAWYRDVG